MKKPGKNLFSIGATLLVVSAIVWGIWPKAKKLDMFSPKPSKQEVLLATPAGPFLTTVKVGETSVEILIVKKRFVIFPDDDGVVFELTDIQGKKTEWRGRAKDWKDEQIVSVRFKPTKHDIAYYVEPW